MNNGRVQFENAALQQKRLLVQKQKKKKKSRGTFVQLMHSSRRTGKVEGYMKVIQLKVNVFKIFFELLEIILKVIIYHYVLHKRAHAPETNKHNETQHEYTQRIIMQHNDTQYNDIRYN
jgi:hypothetical protein